jgi:DNA-binding SARP family transcriptional activator
MNGLIELLWGPDSPPSAVNIIHKYVGVLRRLLEPDLAPRAAGTYLTRAAKGYCFLAGPETLDLVRFRGLVADAKVCTGRDELDEALDRYVEALRLVHGPAGDGLADTPAAQAAFASLDGEFSDAVVTAAKIAVQLRRPSLLLTPLQQAAEMDPLNEFVQACLVTTLAAAGRPADALTAYQSIRRQLGDELGIAPGQDLEEAYWRVLSHSVPPSSVAAPTGLVVRPAQLPPDLQAFTGRRNELATLGRLVAGLRDGGRTSPLVVAVYGRSGMGKSTLAVHFAHLVAAGFTDGCFYVDLRGNQPDEERMPVDDALRALLHGLGVRSPDMAGTFDARVGTYRSLTADKRIVILLDNVCDAGQVRSLLPSAAGSLVLLTSRRPLLELAAHDGAHLMRLDVPDLSTARDLFLRRLAGLPHERTVTKVVDEIIELCGRLPLALTLLAARLTADPGQSLATVVAGLRNGAARTVTVNSSTR